MTLLLASGSKTRAQILKKAKIGFKVVDHGVDEEELKISLNELSPKDISIRLSEIKAIKPSMKHSEDFVIGSDQVLDFNGSLINKAAHLQEAKKQLLDLSGKTHKLITAITIAKNGVVVWKHYDVAKITMRELSEKQIDEYLYNMDKETLGCVGVYAIEQEGIKLLNKIDGDYFSILGLPLLPLTQFLWQNNILYYG
jgi:septum formation protein|tara:strand:+ start:155 stop:745 length:591 start_codon:yes stop_codon:yes gene_type:complete